MKKFFEEFKAFALKGNVVDMAVGVIIGGAFGAIVTSLINDIIMPVLGLIIKADFSTWFIPMKEIPAELLVDGAKPSADVLAEAGISVFHYGKFISAIIYFIPQRNRRSRVCARTASRKSQTTQPAARTAPASFRPRRNNRIGRKGRTLRPFLYTSPE